MKYSILSFGFFCLFATAIFAQTTTEQDHNCKMLCSEGLDFFKHKEFKNAITSLIKADSICHELTKDQYDMLITSLRTTYSSEKEKSIKAAYLDTLLDTYIRSEEKGFYDQSNDMTRAQYIVLSSKPDREKANQLFKRGIQRAENEVSETQLTLFYYNLYSLYSESQSTTQKEYKKQLFEQYLIAITIAGNKNMSLKTKEILALYFNSVFKSCDDILPVAKEIIDSLPQNKKEKLSSASSLFKILEDRECASSKEYEMLLDTLTLLVPPAESKLLFVRFLIASKKYNEAIKALDDNQSLFESTENKEEASYYLALATHRLGDYSNAYTLAMKVAGVKKKEALLLAASCVYELKDQCGSTIFENKCNCLYAAQLAEQAEAKDLAVSYRKAGPTKEEVKANGNLKKITLTCWKVNVIIQ